MLGLVMAMSRTIVDTAYEAQIRTSIRPVWGPGVTASIESLPDEPKS